MSAYVHLKQYEAMLPTAANALFLSTVQFYDIPTSHVNNTRGNTGSFKKSHTDVI